MDVKDIDQLILRKKEMIHTVGDLDIMEYKEDMLNIENILLGIKIEASKLKTDFNNDEFYIPQLEVTSGGQIKSGKLIGLDQRFKRFKFYTKTIRPWLQKVYHKRCDGKFIFAKDLLKYDGIEFIETLYWNLLKRRPELEEIRHHLELLYTHKSNYIDILYNFSQLDEVNKDGIRIKGLYRKKKLNQIQKGVQKIPVVGYLIRWGIACIGLPIYIEKIKNNTEYCKGKIQMMEYESNIDK